MSGHTQYRKPPFMLCKDARAWFRLSNLAKYSRLVYEYSSWAVEETRITLAKTMSSFHFGSVFAPLLPVVAMLCAIGS